MSKMRDIIKGYLNSDEGSNNRVICLSLSEDMVKEIDELREIGWSITGKKLTRTKFIEMAIEGFIGEFKNELDELIRIESTKKAAEGYFEDFKKELAELQSES